MRAHRRRDRGDRSALAGDADSADAELSSSDSPALSGPPIKLKRHIFFRPTGGAGCGVRGARAAFFADLGAGFFADFGAASEFGRGAAFFFADFGATRRAARSAAASSPAAASVAPSSPSASAGTHSGANSTRRRVSCPVAPTSPSVMHARAQS